MSGGLTKHRVSSWEISIKCCESSDNAKYLDCPCATEKAYCINCCGNTPTVVEVFSSLLWLLSMTCFGKKIKETESKDFPFQLVCLNPQVP